MGRAHIHVLYPKSAAVHVTHLMNQTGRLLFPALVHSSAHGGDLFGT